MIGVNVARRVDGDDHLHVYDALRRGPDDAQVPQQHALGMEWRGFWIAGIRGYAFAVAMAGANFPLMPAAWHPAAERVLH